MGATRAEKNAYFEKLKELLAKYCEHFIILLTIFQINNIS